RRFPFQYGSFARQWVWSSAAPPFKKFWAKSSITNLLRFSMGEITGARMSLKTDWMNLVRSLKTPHLYLYPENPPTHR
ncbi:MAG: hypothetical protein AB1798_21355, partial [Spirochaetota bacterium]